MDLNFNNITTDEKEALIEQKELLIKKGYADRGINLKVEKFFHEFIHKKNIMKITEKSMKLAKRLLVKESFRLKNNNGEDLLKALLEKVLAIKNHYTAITNCSFKYIELLNTCGQDLALLSIYDHREE